MKITRLPGSVYAVDFESIQPWGALQRSGERPHTVRVLSDEEYSQLLEAGVSIVRIIDQHGNAFARNITGIYDMTAALADFGVVTPEDMRVIEICWGDSND